MLNQKPRKSTTIVLINAGPKLIGPKGDELDTSQFTKKMTQPESDPRQQVKENQPLKAATIAKK